MKLRCYFCLLVTRSVLFLVLGFIGSNALAATSTVVRLQTSLGSIDIELFDTAAPLTVANFLSYVNSGAYDNSFVHRSVPGFIIQGGGYTWNSALNQYVTIAENAPVVNEFSATRSNLRGTVAMAKLGGNPDSATTQWFINLADNSANLDAQNGGFTVFGQVIGNGMQVADAIAALSVVNAGGAFTDLPLATAPTGSTIQQSNLVMVTPTVISAAIPDASVPTTISDDRVFAYAEANYPSFFTGTATAGQYQQYNYRYYPASDNYLAVDDNGVIYILGAFTNGVITAVGLVENFRSQITAWEASMGLAY